MVANCCIHCGATPNVNTYTGNTPHIGHYISCSNTSCKIRGGTNVCDTEDDAVKQWNSYYGKIKMG